MRSFAARTVLSMMISVIVFSSIQLNAQSLSTRFNVPRQLHSSLSVFVSNDQYVATYRLKADDTTGVRENPDEKNGVTGLYLSLFGTLAPVGIATAIAVDKEKGDWDIGFLALSGLVLGPSFGYFYADEVGRAFGGIGIRLGITALSLLTFPYGLVIGPILIFIDDIVDIASVKPMIDKKYRSQHTMKIQVAPLYSSQTNTSGFRIHIVF